MVLPDTSSIAINIIYRALSECTARKCANVDETYGGVVLSGYCRCLSRAQELGSPHIAAYAKLALSRWAIQHHVQPLSHTTFDTMNSLQQQQQQPLVTPGDPSQPGDTDEDVRYQDASGAGPSVVAQVSEAARKVQHVAHRSCLEAAAPCGMTQTVPDTSAATPGGVNTVPLVPFLFGQLQVLKQPNQWRVGSSISKATMQHAGVYASFTMCCCIVAKCRLRNVDCNADDWC